MHWQRWRKHGDPLATETPNRGSGRTTSKGYIVLRRPEHPLARQSGWVAEHRMVAWDAGLLTDPAMHVHHRDGNKQNNILTNLAILTEHEHHALHAASSSPGRNAAKTHCPKGHPYDEANTWIDGKGSRSCKTCRAVSNRRRREETACD